MREALQVLLPGIPRAHAVGHAAISWVYVVAGANRLVALDDRRHTASVPAPRRGTPPLAVLAKLTVGFLLALSPEGESWRGRGVDRVFATCEVNPDVVEDGSPRACTRSRCGPASPRAGSP